jgi:hypothetical protein
MEVPCSLVSDDHRNGRASPGDEQQMPVLAHNLPLLAHIAYLENLNLKLINNDPHSSILFSMDECLCKK